MMEEKKFVNKPVREMSHNVILEGRRKLSVSGVEDVESFDELTVILYTSMGNLTIKGGNLHINKLSVESGEVVVEGDIDSLVYSDNENSKDRAGFFTKLFR